MAHKSSTNSNTSYCLPARQLNLKLVWHDMFYKSFLTTRIRNLPLPPAPPYPPPPRGCLQLSPFCTGSLIILHPHWPNSHGLLSPAIWGNFFAIFIHFGLAKCKERFFMYRTDTFLFWTHSWTSFLLYFLGDFFFVLYSTLLHLPPLRFHCADGCWDRIQDRCNWCIGSQTF